MLYSQLLQSEHFKKAFEKAKVSDIQSPLLKDGDFPSGYPDDLFTNPNKNSHLVDSLHKIADLEIIERCRHAQYDQILIEEEARLKPLREREAKIQYLKPVVQKYLANNLKPEFRNLEDSFVNLIAKETVEGNEFQVHPDRGFESGHHQYDNSISELQNLIKKSSIIRLDDDASPDEIILKTIFKNGYSKLLKP